MPVPVGNLAQNAQANPDVQGGNDPVRQAALQSLRGLSPATNPQQMAGAPGAGPQGAAPSVDAQGQPIQNEVGVHLANAFEALIRTGPTQENLAALSGFLQSVQQLSPGEPQAPQGQGPLPPGQPGVGSGPLPAASAPAGPRTPGPLG